MYLWSDLFLSGRLHFLCTSFRTRAYALKLPPNEIRLQVNFIIYSMVLGLYVIANSIDIEKWKDFRSVCLLAYIQSVLEIRRVSMKMEIGGLGYAQSRRSMCDSFTLCS